MSFYTLYIFNGYSSDIHLYVIALVQKVFISNKDP